MDHLEAVVDPMHPKRRGLPRRQQVLEPAHLLHRTPRSRAVRFDENRLGEEDGRHHGRDEDVELVFRHAAAQAEQW